MRKKTVKQYIAALLFLFFLAVGADVRAQDESSSVFRSTNFPLPRFVSLNAGEVNVRTGPGQRYPVKWVFKKKGLPVEIILEFEHWRKIRDYEGEEGWIHKSLLTGRRSGLIRSEDLVLLYRKPEPKARLLAYMEPGALAQVERCKGIWCEIETGGYKGWAERKFIWGVYENENFD